jgi:hypothetical protein
MLECDFKEEVTIHNKGLQYITALSTTFGQLLPPSSGVLCRDFRNILHTAGANHPLTVELDVVCSSKHRDQRIGSSSSFPRDGWGYGGPNAYHMRNSRIAVHGMCKTSPLWYHIDAQ